MLHDRACRINRMSDRRTPFFIIGTGRCGSTLLQRMLMAHDDVVIPPETHFFSRFDPTRLVGADPLPDALVDRWIEGCRRDPWFDELGIDADALRQAAADGCRTSHDLFWWFFDTLAPGVAPRPGEKTPHHEKYIDRIRAMFPEAKFVHIHRDPRDVVVSLHREDWMHGASYQRIAHHVAKVLRRQERVEATLGASYHRLRFEDLLAEPEAVLRRLCEFLDLEFRPSMLAYHTQSESGFLETERGWKDLATKPLDPSRIGRYRSRLTPRQIRMIERTAGPLLQAYGYSVDDEVGTASWWAAADAFERLGWVGQRLRLSVAKRLGGAGGERAT